MYYVSNYEVTHLAGKLICIWKINKKVVPYKLYVSEQGIARYGKDILKYNKFQTEDYNEALGYISLERL